MSLLFDDFFKIFNTKFNFLIYLKRTVYFLFINNIYNHCYGGGNLCACCNSMKTSDPRSHIR